MHGLKKRLKKYVDKIIKMYVNSINEYSASHRLLVNDNQLEKVSRRLLANDN